MCCYGKMVQIYCWVENTGYKITYIVSSQFYKKRNHLSTWRLYIYEECIVMTVLMYIGINMNAHILYIWKIVIIVTCVWWDCGWILCLKKFFLKGKQYLNNPNGKSFEAKDQAPRPVRGEGRVLAESPGHLGPGVTPAQTSVICGALEGAASSLNLGVGIWRSASNNPYLIQWGCEYEAEWHL